MPDYDPIIITMNDKPRAIVGRMDSLHSERDQVKNRLSQRRWIPLILFLSSFPFLCIDFVMSIAGYPALVFSLVTPVLWVSALVSFIMLRRNRILEIPPLYNMVQEIIHTLRDDFDPKRNLFGQLDLTGTQKPEKIARENPNALGLITQYYRDEWLSLKGKLYDGNMLRLSAVRREKVRKGYWKRSMSGKRKWKAPKFKGTLQELKVRISVNPEIYEIVNKLGLRQGFQIGTYTIQQVDTTGGIINLLARSGTDLITSNDVLNVLRCTYDILQRKAYS